MPPSDENDKSKPLRVNIGCGQTPTPGWRNFDNSPSVRLARLPLPTRILEGIGILQKTNSAFIKSAEEHRVEFADAARSIPLPADSVDTLYSSHMIEHLDRMEAISFLAEVRRVLRPNGVIRLVAPDLAMRAQRYAADGDADAFMASLNTCMQRPRTLTQRAKLFLYGQRDHNWMYDGRSLVKLLEQQGFVEASILPPGKTIIARPGELDLREREDESVYVEARKPTSI